MEKQQSEYTITYELSDGSFKEEDAVYVVDSFSADSGAVDIYAVTPVKDGVTFEGWYTDSKLTTSAPWFDGVLENKTYYAKWVIRLDFDANATDAEGEMDSIDLPEGEGEEVTLTANAYTRDSYTFAGWSTTADGEVTYADGATFNLTQSTTLYAVWTINAAD